MTDSQKLEQLKVLLEIKDVEDEEIKDVEDELLLALLNIAGQKILDRVYPYNHTIDEVPTRYEVKQIEIAVYLYNKQGAEGQTAHSENGISRTYGSADVPESMLRGIAPFVGGIK